MEFWLQRCFEILIGGPDASTGEVLLRGALIGCTLFASVQLLTMLGTRWGDHHAMAKSFILSVMVHLCIGLGWATVVELQNPTDALPGESTPIPIRQVLLESPEELSQPDEGNTPIWQKPIDLPDRDVERTQRETATLPLEQPQRLDSEPLPPAPPEMSQLPTAAPDDSAQAPEVLAAAETQPIATPVEAPPAEAPATASRSESSGVPSMASRQTLERSPELETLPVVDPRAGTAQRTAPTTMDSASSLPLPLDQNPTLPKPVGPEGDTIARMASPAALPVEASVAGSATLRPGTSNASNPSSSGFTRSTPVRASSVPAPSPGRVEATMSSRDGNQERFLTARRPSLAEMHDAPEPSLIRNNPTTAPVGDRAQAATTYRLRRLERRRDIALRNGGTAASEQAVENALAYLARMQESDGRWDADRHGGGLKETRQIDAGKPPGGAEADTGVTGLSILAFLGAGYTHEEGEYAEVVSRAVDWLIAQQRSDGYLGGASSYYDQMYCHGIATYALAEAYGMQSDPTQFPALREAVSRGCWYISETQNADGGWRYRVGASLSDMSMFGWQLMALKSAELAGLPTRADTRAGMIQFLRDRSLGSSGGLAGYKRENPPTPAMTAEAFFCKQMYGLRQDSPAGMEAARYLQANLPRLSEPDEYYWYYGTLSMFQYGGEPWQAWNASLRDNLVRLQRRGGTQSGSWDPVGPWGSIGGRIYSTALSTMCLEVYYRFLPLYQVGSPE